MVSNLVAVFELVLYKTITLGESRLFYTVIVKPKVILLNGFMKQQKGNKLWD